MTISLRLLPILFLLFVAGYAPVFAAFRAGIATRNVTPDPLLPVSGGVGPSKPAREKQGELTVRAMVLDGATRMGLIKMKLATISIMIG